MQIAFHGAAQTVTGSRHLLTINGSKLLLDCGMYQGPRQETYLRNQSFPFAPAEVQAVVLSHAHIDHCGNLPHLVGQGFVGPIHGTQASRHLTDILNQDAAHIQESDAAYLNKRLAREGKPLVRPLFTIEQAAAASRHLVGQDYNVPFEPVPGVTATLVEAGHILGSAGVILRLEEKGRVVRLMFSGDIGRRHLPIIRDPVLPEDVDYLVMECTYGDTVHDSPQKAYEEMKAVIRRTVERRGKVIIPAFALGRTQTLVYYLHQMIEAHEIPRIPAYVDSPLAVSVTEVFQEHPECFDEEMQEFMRKDPDGQALGFDLLTYTRSVEESKAINDKKGPLVIISASGMAETGRILHHLRNNIEDSRNTILITSWMAPHTLGRRLVEGEKVVRIFGEEFPVRAEVACINGLSAHAGQDSLLAYTMAVRGRVREIFLVHGEPRSATVFQQKLAEAGFARVWYPRLGDSSEL